MGPTILFDKSFLQSLSVDESMWFDNFFIPNICPLFYVETLADLKKSLKMGRTPEQHVGQLADKFPEMSGTPCVFHVDMCHANLLGQEIPMRWQIPKAGGSYVELDGKKGSVFQLSAEADAFMRWQKREFNLIEYLFAKAWRISLSSIDLKVLSEQLDIIGIRRIECRTIAEANKLAEDVTHSTDLLIEKMKMLFSFLSSDRSTRREILKRWFTAGLPQISSFAPYAAYVFKIEILLRLCVAAKLISYERPSNKIDISYLFYLPFCMIFVSSDKLHARFAPHLIREDQDFVWGEDLKKDLSQLNTYYSKLPENIQEEGIYSFAHHPPKDEDYLVTRLWNKHFPGWQDKENSLKNKLEKDPKFLAYLNKIEEAATHNIQGDSEMSQPDWMIIQHRIHKKKGSWWQLPKKFNDSDDK